ncbi:MAG: GspH/FimT family pseudopilin [Ectothiorhodospiraceae bacterium]|nr:GspH/FimT family pseudopilin [Chromatiales bacterium]MCP5155333.1 GspH/FimT family pseudopilin [Ectothiorhodospiraceae bacterium]
MRKQRGITLVELIVALVVAGILAALGAPSLRDIFRNNARSTRLNDMVLALNYARSQAVGRSARITVCEVDLRANPNPTQCTNHPNPPTTGVFQTGWMVFLDNAAGTTGVVDAGETVLRIFQPDGAGDATFIGRRASDDALAGFLSYTANGLLDQPNGGIYFVYCDGRGNESGRMVQVSPTGQARVSRDDDGDGLHEASYIGAVKEFGGGVVACP